MLINQLSPQLEQLLKIKFGIVGNSDVMKQAISMLMQSAPTELSVLITGETGTGKEIFANAIHGLSERKNSAFVSVNCGAIPENLLESELFGHERGAFTDAKEMRKGFFEVAHKGTIFLDEIGEMPYNTQVKLLRVLESGEYTRLGSSNLRKVDIRVIAATNRNLEYEVNSGNFRQDLYFRLKNVHIVLPSLNEHIDDIPLLYEYFAKALSHKLKIKYFEPSQEILQILKLQPWLGNVREFKNFIETIITLEKNSELSPSVLRKYIKPVLPPHTNQAILPERAMVFKGRPESEMPEVELGLIFRTLLELQNDVTDLKHISISAMQELASIKEQMENQSFQQYEESIEDISSIDINTMTIEEVEKRMVINALEKYEGNRRQAAESLGVSQRTLYRKIIQYEI